MINIALRAARTAAESLLQTGDRLDRVKVIESDAENYCSSADQDAESTIIYHLQKAYPSHSYATRLGTTIEGTAGEPLWLVDPLVGSFNYHQGLNQYGIAIACKIDEAITHSVLLLPLLDEEFTASRGTGVQLNKRRIRVRNMENENSATIALNPHSDSLKVVPSLIEGLHQSNTHLRISGCTAIDMAYTATGRYAGGWCGHRASPAEHAASLLLLESGALLGSENGNPNLTDASELIFGAPKLFKAMVRLRNSISS